MMEEKVKRTRTRTKPAMVHVNVRLPAWVLDYYKQQSTSYTKMLRDVLVQHAQEGQTKIE